MATLKLFHVLFVFIWVGGLLALTRLMAYQAKQPEELQGAMARIYRRMYFFIDLPSMILAVAFGLTLLFLKETNWRAPWLHLKLTAAFFLIACDIICGYLIVRLTRRPVLGRGIWYKIFHGIVGLLLIVILIAIYIMKNKG